VARKVLNVDRLRDRCPIMELDQAKLRRVAFCVDVEVAPMPKYGEENGAAKKSVDKVQKRKMVEKGEGEALKHAKAVDGQKEQDGETKKSGEDADKELKQEGNGAADPSTKEVSPERPAEKGSESRKKEKKKKSEEERKARKEKKRKLAEANGTIPMEIYNDSDSSGLSSPSTEGPKAQVVPTTNPVRIYRRCCQLRETPILKKITEQLTNPSNISAEVGMVEKLDLTGYWMQLADLITLGDYLAVVPVRELVLENCGLTDESLRVILAALLAVKKSGIKRRKLSLDNDDPTSHSGVVERVVLKNNKIGPEGWRHICLFLYMCRSLRFLDVSSISFPQTPLRPNRNMAAPVSGTPDVLLNVDQLLAKSLAERPGGSTLSLLNIGETGINMKQLGTIIDGVIQCGVRRLGLAHNNIDAEGVQEIAKYLSSGKCEGLDLGGNDMGDQMEALAGAISDSDPLWALSLAECNLQPASLRVLFPKLIPLSNFRFIDLSHNHDLFDSQPSALPVLRR
jgi:hypothetical protein